VDEARFVFEFIDRGGNARAPGGGSPGQGGGQKSDPTDYQDTQGKADDQNTKRTKKPPTAPASVPGTQASKPSDTKPFSLSDTVSEIGGIVGQASSAMKGLPTGPLDALAKGKAIGDAATRAVAIGDQLFGGVGQAAATAAGVAGRAGAAGVGGAGGAGAAAAGGIGAAAATAAGPVAAFAALAMVVPTAVATAISKASDYADATVARAGDYSPEVARARANAEVSQIMADIRSANRLGPTLAQGIEDQAALNARSQNLKDKLAEPFIKAGNDLKAIAEGVARFADQNTEDGSVAKTVYDKLSEVYLFGPITKAIADGFRKSREDEAEISYFDWFRQQPHIAPPNMTFDEDESVKDPRFSPVPGLVF